MVDSGPSINDISTIIRQKERELHDIHERRCIHLEKTIEERDKAVTDLSKKFSQLREDFKYNLSLLEARDNEIRRLEGVGNALNSHLQTLQAEKSSLMNRLEKMLSREQERKERAKSDAAMQKHMLIELQQEMEAAKWATAEEVKSRQNELDKCRDDMRRMQTERENALSLQRRDMTSAFEQLVAQREATFSQREQEIVGQIASLEKRIESTHTENTRLKSELADTLRQRDKMSLDAERREETIRQLQWKIDDSLETWKRREDALERSLHEALNEVNLCRDSLMKQIGDSQLDIDRCRMEVRRERDLREAAEEKNKDMRILMDDRLKEVRAAAEERIKMAGVSTDERLREVKNDHKREIDRLVNQVIVLEETITQLRAQVSAAESQESASNVAAAAEIKLLKEAADKSATSIENYKNEIFSMEKQLQTSMDGSARRISEMEAALAAKNQEHTKQVSELKAHIALLEGQVANMQSNQASELELHKAALDAEMIINGEEQESSRFSLHLQELQSKVMFVSSERDRLRAELQDFKSQLEEQTMECSALRLRLQLYETNFGQSQKGFGINSNLKANNLVHPSALSPSFRRGDMNLVSKTDYPSPMFTEDQGSISIPGSPDGRFLYNGSSRYNIDDRDAYNDLPDGYSGREGFYPSAQSRVPPLHGASAPATARRYSDPNSSNDSLAKLAEDNNRLREVIKDMRREMEVLPGHRDADAEKTISEQRERITDLENQLSQSLKEIARLRVERKKLMDVGNELKASLFHLQHRTGFSEKNDYNPTHSLEGGSMSDHGSRYNGLSGLSGPLGRYRDTHNDNPWGHGENNNDPVHPPIPPSRQNDRECENYRQANHSDRQSALRANDPRTLSAGTDYRGEGIQDDGGVEGEPLALTALPLPPGRHSSNRTTDSQRRVLQRLKQTQLKQQAPRKVMNYAAAHHA